MEKSLLLCVAGMLLLPIAAQAGLWDPAIDQPSFEQTFTGWTNWTDDWFDSDYWGTFLIPEGGVTYPDTPYGEVLGGVDGTGTMWQQVGTWEAGQIYEVSFMAGQRSGGGIQSWEVSGGIIVALYGGGTGAADNETPVSIGATLLDSIGVQPFTGVEIATTEIAVSLNTGTGLVTGDPLWLAFEGVAAGQKVFDNVAIVAVVSATLVSPQDGATTVAIDAQLVWGAPVAYDGPRYDIYFGTTEPNVLEANYGLTWLNEADAKTTATSIDPNSGGGLSFETTYYWVIDTYEPNELGGDIVHRGPHWSFTTVEAAPVIVTQPASQTVAAGDPVTFSVVGLNIVGYQWYKDGEILPGETGADLTIDDVQLGAEGGYHCIVTNGNPVDDIASDSARLLTQRLMAHWDFEGDLIDEVEGIVGFYSDPEIANPNPVATWDPNSIEGEQAFAFGDEPYFVAVDIPEYFDFTAQGYTVSAWVKVTVAPLGWDTYISKGGSYWLNAETTWLTQVGTDGWTWSTYPVLEDKGWHHTTATYDPAEGVVKYYVDGLLHNQYASTPPSNVDPLIFGAADTTGRGRYYGSLDDVQIYSYARDPYVMANEYVVVVPEANVCVEGVGPYYDYDDDCDVDLADFAEFALQWLNCNRVAGAGSGLIDCK